MTATETVVPSWVEQLKSTVSELVSELFKQLSSGEVGPGSFKLHFRWVIVRPGQLQSYQDFGGFLPQFESFFSILCLKHLNQVRLRICPTLWFRSPTAHHFVGFTFCPRDPSSGQVSWILPNDYVLQDLPGGAPTFLTNGLWNKTGVSCPHDSHMCDGWFEVQR